MTCYICETCGTQYAEAAMPPPNCPICLDDRQYVGWRGQRWTTMEELAASREVVLSEDHGLPALTLNPGFAINQRALIVPTEAGNLLWESLSLVTPSAVEAIKALGGIAMIAISHPHFYTSVVEWSDAFGGIPIYLHEDDKNWLQRQSLAVRFWSGESLVLSKDAMLIRTGGHFPGSTVLHWKSDLMPGGALLSGDSHQVAMNRNSVSFMYSYPNMVPMSRQAIAAIQEKLADIEFDRVYGYSRERVIECGGRAAVDRSFARFLKNGG